MCCVLYDHPRWVMMVVVVVVVVAMVVVVVVVVVPVVCLQEIYDIYIVINSHNFICILWYYFHRYHNIFLPLKAAYFFF